MLIDQLAHWPKARKTSNGYDVCCPAHEDKEPSLSVCEIGGRLLFKCHAGCLQEAVLEAMERLGVSTSTRVEASLKLEPFQRVLQSSRPASGQAEAVKYFNARGLDTDLLRHLRFCSSLSFREGDVECQYAALVLPVRRAPEAEPMAVQRIYIQDGAKAPVSTPKKSLGPIKGGAFWIGESGRVMTLCEGPETGCSVAEATRLPCVVTLGAENMRHIKNPSCCEELHIFGDRDVADTGLKAANTLADQLRREGKRVWVHIPPINRITNATKRDWNDVHREEGADAIRAMVENAPQLEGVSAKDSALPEWPEPIPFQRVAVTLPDLPMHVLPQFARDFIAFIARTVGIIESLPFAMFLLVVGGIGGRAFVSRPHPQATWKVMLNLFGMVVASPSSRKSASYSAFAAFIHLIERIFAERAKRAASDAEPGKRKTRDRISVIERKLKKDAELQEARDAMIDEQLGLEATLASEGTPPTRLSTGDASVEKLVDLLKENPAGISLSRDEIGAVFSLLRKSGWEMFGELLLEGWNGTNPFTLDRVGRGTTTLEATCLSVFGTIQPSRLDRIVRNYTDGGDGLLSRFQVVVYQLKKPKWKPSRDVMPTDLENRMRDFLLAIAEQRHAAAHSLHMCDAALDLFEPWQDQQRLELEPLSEDAQALESHLGKYPSLVLKLATILQLAHDFENAALPLRTEDDLRAPAHVRWSEEIGLPALKGAFAIADVLQAHAEHMYRPLLNREHMVATALLKKILTGKVTDGTRARDIKQAGWANLSEEGDVELALATLERNHILCVERTRSASGRGRPSDVLRINPKISKWTVR